MKLRRRSKMAQNNKKLFKKAFGNEPVKLLGIPQIIDNYNYHKSEVDRFDQTRSYYSIQQARQRTWRPLWYFLIDLTLNNCYRLSPYSSPTAVKQSGHKKLIYKLIEQLFERGGRPASGSTKRQRPDEVVTSGEGALQSSHTSTKLFAEGKSCVNCAAAGRTTNRKDPSRTPLARVTGNSRSSRHGSQRPPRTCYGCKLCRLPLCRPDVTPTCWEEHLRRHETIISTDTRASSSIT
ncbi:hypothetical protein BU23DRAFT_599188 [Bimuria novae-zelandiae CBS 107.79]|uniref:PiggyBac transposable element-derived protein domain-containing protein n=1 Tax=Bimuria novae-zelandiae CBS 107.79 TaxID=1447943 RepID=A0A6A5V749_9PLEO|nr:hypothetical protein BU23DRAFT_599188 [Bimuria novae-zelandiae CBS 107.79]